MRVLSNKEMNYLKQFFQIKQSTLKRVMERYLEEKYTEVIKTEKYVIAIGDIPVALVAHLDTVFKSPPQEIYYDRQANVIWSPDGLGADDRAGVYSIVQILKDGYRPTVILTTDEECGGIGAAAIEKDFRIAPTTFKYIIELDRQGEKDCVFYYCNNDEFEEYVESFGFETAIGSYTDICEFCPAWGVAGVNLSIGYKHEHSYSEILNLNHMYNTIKKVETMLDQINEAKSYIYINANWWESYDSKWFKDLYDGIAFKTNKCNHCSKEFDEYELFDVYNELTEIDIKLCADCLTSLSNLNWCESCRQPFIYIKGNNRKICNRCEKKGHI